MQTFKEIPFQNYIELKFNSKNLNELAQQEAMIKYKRNAQLLAEIFTFDHKQRENFPSQDAISSEELEEMSLAIEREKQASQRKVEQVKEDARKYDQISNSIKEIKNKEELFAIIDRLREEGLYDDSHPYFVQDSPFYLSPTQQECQQVVGALEVPSEEGLSLLQIN